MSGSYEMMRHRADNEGDRIAIATRSYVLPGAGASVERQAGSNDDLDFDLRAVLHAMVRRRMWVYLCTATMTAIAALVCLLMTPQYQAESTVEILKQNAGPLPVGSDAAANANSDPLDFSMTLQTQMTVLNSDTLAWQVIRELKLLKPEDLPPGATSATGQGTLATSNFRPDKEASELLKQFRRNLGVSSVAGTRLIRVSYLDSDPKRAAAIVNRLVSDFIEYNFRVRYDATSKATEWLGGQLVELKAQVEQAQNRAVELQRDSGIFGEDEHHNIVLTRLEQLNNELTSAEADRVIKENIYRQARSGNPEVVANLLGSQTSGAGGANSATLLTSLRQQEATIAAQYADAAAKYGPAYPRLIQLKDQLNSVRSLLSAEIAKVTQRALSDYDLSLARETSARNAFTRQKATAAEMNDKATNYLIAKQEADSSRRLYQHLLEEVKEAGVLAGLHSSDLHVVDQAAVPLLPAKPKVPLYIAAGMVSGILLGIICVFVVEVTDRTVRDVGEIEARTFVAVLGVIPQAGKLSGTATQPRLSSRTTSILNAPVHSALRALDDPAVAEAFRSLRTSLLLSRPETLAQVFLVTSGLQQEGKTFTSFHLAVALARKETRVLLIDADMRRGTLSRALNKKSEVGLSHVLLGEASIESACQEVKEIRGLTFMSAGRSDASAAELLESARMTDLLRNCRDRFTHIVIDTPPVLMVTDAVVLAPRVDAVLVVARFAETNREAMARTMRVLQSVHPARIGILLNRMDLRSPEYYCYSGSRGYGEYLRRDFGNDVPIIVPKDPNGAKENA